MVRSGRRHKVGNAHVLEAGDPVRVGDQLLYVGADSPGIELEVIAVSDDRDPGGLAVIHAMPTGFRASEDERTP